MKQPTEEEIEACISHLLFALFDAGLIDDLETDDICPPDYAWTFRGQDMSASAETGFADLVALLSALSSAEQEALGAAEVADLLRFHRE